MPVEWATFLFKKGKAYCLSATIYEVTDTNFIYLWPSTGMVLQILFAFRISVTMLLYDLGDSVSPFHCWRRTLYATHLNVVEQQCYRRSYMPMLLCSSVLKTKSRFFNFIWDGRHKMMHDDEVLIKHLSLPVLDDRYTHLAVIWGCKF